MDFFVHYSNPPVQVVPHLGYNLPTPFDQQSFVPAQSMSGYMHDPNWPAGTYVRPAVKIPGVLGKTTETKPRLAKEEVEQLEAVFQKNNKPSANVKKEIAQQMGVEIARINNWFQNRRAKAKQERNAQEFEARQRRENACASDASSPAMALGPSPASDQSEPLNGASVTNASENYSLDFPSVEEPNLSQTTGAMSSENTYTTSPQASEVPSTASPLAHDTNQHLSFDFDISAPADDYFSQPCAMPNTMSTSMPNLGHQHFPVSMNEFSVGLMSQTMSGVAHFSPPLATPGLQVEADVPQPSIEMNYQHLSPDAAVHSPPMSSPPGPALKSPPAIDLASRRKRPQPAALRTPSYHVGPRTGIDFGTRRSDSSSPLRRVASACGPGPARIQKTLASNAPRSPFIDRRHEQLLGAALCSSPGMQAPATTIGPPTPNTPIVSNTPARRETSSSDDGQFVLSQNLGVPSLADPTLRTPPSTPGIMGFSEMSSSASMDSGINFSLSDETSMAPNMGQFSADMNLGVPDYLADGSLSQPDTPSFPMMGPSYYGACLVGGNQEYNWSDATTTTLKSPIKAVPRTKQLQFTNFTQQDFSDR